MLYFGATQGEKKQFNEKVESPKLLWPSWWVYETFDHNCNFLKFLVNKEMGLTFLGIVTNWIMSVFLSFKNS